ncbi:MAG: beta propeller repeat protein [Acidimicrobiales bacterium]
MILRFQDGLRHVHPSLLLRRRYVVRKQSTNGGNTWAIVGQSSGISASSPAAVSCASQTGCTVVAQNIATGSSEIFSTSDGGASWTRTALAGTSMLGAISCPSQNTCWVVGYGAGGSSVIATDAS